MAYTTIDKSSLHFNTKLYTGTGSSNTVTGVGFQPDLTWIKNRGDAESHVLFDAVRANGQYIKSDDNSGNIDGSSSGSGLWSAFASDGFTVLNGNRTNDNGNTYASWNWKASGQGSSNTDGSITSTVSASTTSGVSIVKWTGSGGNATIGHGLGVVPKMIIIKSLANTTSWMVYTSMTGNNSEIALNTTAAATASSTAWQDTDPTSSVFYVAGGAGDGVNYSGDYVAYCFAEKTGFSKFGSYTGNGNADGSFIYTGFKPAFVLIKDTGRAESWYIFDNRRLGYNGAMADFLANTNAAEASSSATLLDFVSNGFKLRGTTDHLNGNGQNFLYMAFAEAPLVGSNNVPATAR